MCLKQCANFVQAAKADADASQIVAYPTDSQKQNVQIVNILANFQVLLSLYR